MSASSALSHTEITESFDESSTNINDLDNSVFEQNSLSFDDSICDEDSSENGPQESDEELTSGSLDDTLNTRCTFENNNNHDDNHNNNKDEFKRCRSVSDVITCKLNLEEGNLLSCIFVSSL